jgi:drug/metabolite transporter (DMT)-like permease
MHRRAAPIFLALASAVLFGSATPASKVLLTQLSTFQLAGLLYLGAALAMGPLVVRQPHIRLAQLDANNRRRLFGAIATGGLIAPVLLLAGLRLAPAASVSLLLNLEMAATAVLGALLFREPLGRIGWVGAAGIVAAGAMLSGGHWPGIAAALLVAGAACAGDWTTTSLP